MKIGINARLLHSEILEGVARYVWETTKWMVLNNPNDQFYFFFDRPYPAKFIISNNIVPVIIPPQARHPLLFYYWFEIALKRAVRKLDLDVFYSGENFTSLSLDIPSLLVVHDLAYIHYPKHIPRFPLLYYRHFMPKFIKKADHIVCVSNFVKQDILAHFDVHSLQISVGYNALPQRDYYLTQKDFGLYFLFVGSINPRKNIYNVLLAFTRFINEFPDYKFIIVGRKSGLDRKTEKLFADLLEKGNIIHLTNVSDSELPSIIEGANSFIYVSYFEGFGIPLLEAMSHGIPVLTSNVTSMPEVAGNAAITVTPSSIQSIYEGMKEISTNQTLRKTLIQNGYKRIKDFSWDATSSMIWEKIMQISKN